MKVLRQLVVKACKNKLEEEEALYQYLATMEDAQNPISKVPSYILEIQREVVEKASVESKKGET